MQTIGITGGIGSGKSTIARELAKRGFAVYDCDLEAKRIIAENKDVQKKIIALLGEEAFVINPSCSEAEPSIIYNTSYVAQKVFAFPLSTEKPGGTLLERLNAIIHPAVKEDICQRSNLLAKRSGSHLEAVLFIESAILYEAGLDSICDKIFVIDAPEEIRIARTIARDYHGDASPENTNKVRARIRAQKSFSPSFHPSITIVNDGQKSINELAEEIIALLN